MSCVVLVGGGIGCGKTTLIKYLHQNKSELFGCHFCDTSNACLSENTHADATCMSCNKFFILHFDELCSIEEQEKLASCKT